MGYPTLASIQTVYEFLSSRKLDARLTHLTFLMEYTHGLLSTICDRHRPPPTAFRVNKDAPTSPIIPLFTARARSLAEHCQRRGFMLRPIVAPTVPTGTDRVRLCLHASNTNQQVVALCKAIEDWVLEQLSEENLAPSTFRAQPQLQSTCKL